MNLRIKNAKKFVALFVAMLFCGSMFGQQQFVDLHLSNVHVSGGNLNFTVKLKAGANYGTDDWRITTSNIFIDVVDQHGSPAIYFNPHQGVTLTTFPERSVFSNLAWKVMSSSGADYRLGLTLTKTWYTNPVYTIDDEYMIVANYSVPYASGNPVGAFLKITSFSEPHPDETMWHALEPNGTVHNYNEYNVSKPTGYPIESGCPTQALWTGTVDSDWLDTDNWVNPVDGTSSGIPCATTNVYISGTAPHYPMLTGNNRNTSGVACNEIVFFQGGQVGRMDLLRYNKARVQLNLQSPGQSGSDDFVNEYYKYAYKRSSAPLAYGQWHMLSVPMQNVFSGDLGYGGYPMTFMRKFNVNKLDTGNFAEESDWSESYVATNEPLTESSSRVSGGFAFYAYAPTSSFGCVYEDGTAPGVTGATGYGLGQTSGILEIPTYDKGDNLNSHRIQTYIGNTSTFYDVSTSEGGQILGSNKTVTRNATNDFRFIWDNGNPVSIPTAGLSYAISDDGDERYILLGNPFMSALDFDAFYARNGSSGNLELVENAYKIWDGTEFITYNCATQTATGSESGSPKPFTKYIAPMQGFFVKVNGWNGGVNFLKEMSVVTSGTIQLRNASEVKETNIIRLSAYNQSGLKTNALIGQLNNASAGYNKGEDITKLFSPYKSVSKDKEGKEIIYYSPTPEIYTLAGETALSMNYVGESGAIVPIGIRVAPSGSTTLRLTGMNNYNATKIELLDNNGQFLADITEEDSFEYEFNNGEAGYQNGRFYLRIAESATGIGNVEAKGIQVYKANEAIQVVSSPNDLIKQIRIYDVQGQMLYSKTDVVMDIYSVKEQFDKQQVLIVQVVTEKKTVSVKIKN